LAVYIDSLYRNRQSRAVIDDHVDAYVELHMTSLPSPSQASLTGCIVSSIASTKTEHLALAVSKEVSLVVGSRDQGLVRRGGRLEGHLCYCLSVPSIIVNIGCLSSNSFLAFISTQEGIVSVATAIATAIRSMIDGNVGISPGHYNIDDGITRNDVTEAGLCYDFAVNLNRILDTK
jgi:N-acetylmuramoyl-L-alanine amidase